MRILFFGNNRAAWRVLAWLSLQKEEIAGIVLHPPLKQKFTDEMVSLVDPGKTRVFYGPSLADPGTEAQIRDLHPDIGISVYFDYILKPALLGIFPRGVINLHPAFLPYNRGQYPNVWSIVDRTPAGVTLHYLDAAIDTGDIIARREVPVEPVDTGRSLYRKLEKASVALFRETWPGIRSGTAGRSPQDPAAGTYHRTADVQSIDRIDLDAVYPARYLIDVIRARTFPPYEGAYFMYQGKKVHLQLKLEYD